MWALGFMSVAQKQAQRQAGAGESTLQSIAEKCTGCDGSHCHILVRLVLNFPSLLSKGENASELHSSFRQMGANLLNVWRPHL